MKENCIYKSIKHCFNKQFKKNLWGEVKKHVQIAAGYFMTIHEMEVKDGAVCMLEKKEEEHVEQSRKVKNYRAKRKGRSVIMSNLYMEKKIGWGM